MKNLSCCSLVKSLPFERSKSTCKVFFLQGGLKYLVTVVSNVVKFVGSGAVFIILGSWQKGISSISSQAPIKSLTISLFSLKSFSKFNFTKWFLLGPVFLGNSNKILSLLNLFLVFSDKFTLIWEKSSFRPLNRLHASSAATSLENSIKPYVIVLYNGLIYTCKIWPTWQNKFCNYSVETVVGRSPTYTL